MSDFEPLEGMHEFYSPSGRESLTVWDGRVWVRSDEDTVVMDEEALYELMYQFSKARVDQQVRKIREGRNGAGKEAL